MHSQEVHGINMAITPLNTGLHDWGSCYEGRGGVHLNSMGYQSSQLWPRWVSHNII